MESVFYYCSIHIDKMNVMKEENSRSNERELLYSLGRYQYHIFLNCN